MDYACYCSERVLLERSWKLVLNLNSELVSLLLIFTYSLFRIRYKNIASYEKIGEG